MESSIAEFLSRQLAFGQLPTISYFKLLESSASCSKWANDMRGVWIQLTAAPSDDLKHGSSIRAGGVQLPHSIFD